MSCYEALTRDKPRPNGELRRNLRGRHKANSGAHEGRSHLLRPGFRYEWCGSGGLFWLPFYTPRLRHLFGRNGSMLLGQLDYEDLDRELMNQYAGVVHEVEKTLDETQGFSRVVIDEYPYDAC